MDKKSITGIILITIVFIIWMFYTSTQQRPEQYQNTKDTPAKVSDNTQKKKAPSQRIALNDSATTAERFGMDLSPFASKGEELITIETDLYTTQISSNGAAIRKWTLKKFKKWDKKPTQLIADPRGVLGINIAGKNASIDVMDTRDLRFKFNTKGQKHLKLQGQDSLVLEAVLAFDDNSQIVRTYTFYNGKYHINAGVKMHNMEKLLKQRNYSIEWNKGLSYQEVNSIAESDAAEAVLVSNKEKASLNATASGEEPIRSMGTLDYAATKIKYFAAAIIPQPFRGTNISAQASGKFYSAPDEGHLEKYDLALKVPYDGGVQANNFKIYIGPLDYELCEENGLQDLVYLGWELIVRPIGEFFMLPFFKLIYNIVGNYGIAIILFAIVLKILLYPFSIKQMRSVRAMKLVAPQINAVRGKYKDDQMKQQQETMNIYREYGINPAGGCLPLLLQMPILYALWAVMSNVIDLRQTYFALWITDLSQPDILFKLPFSFLGIKHISGLALFMGITMFLQQKQSLTDPRQKAMVYAMPIMFTLMFANFPAGLNLYYFVFNLLSIAQQYYIEHFSKNKLTLEDLKKAPKKESWMQRKMREAQELQASGQLPKNASFKDLKDLRDKQKQIINNKQNNRKRPNNRNNTGGR